MIRMMAYNVDATPALCRIGSILISYTSVKIVMPPWNIPALVPVVMSSKLCNILSGSKNRSFDPNEVVIVTTTAKITL
jgi:hypothetical protein